MQRTPLAKRVMPVYTHGEEIMNMVTHIVGGGFGVVVLVVTVLVSALHGNFWGIISSAIYGFSMICLYTVSSVYHGLHMNRGKRVMQVIDHCTIYFLIAGTYTPILLAGIRLNDPALAWSVFGVEWGLAALGITLNAIDLRKYRVFSMICYLCMGWMIIISLGACIEAMTWNGFLWLLIGGIIYTAGTILYGVGKYIRYFHAIFHIFVVLGSVFQAVGIIFYIL